MKLLRRAHEGVALPIVHAERQRHQIPEALIVRDFDEHEHDLIAQREELLRVVARLLRFDDVNLIASSHDHVGLSLADHLVVGGIDAHQ